MDPREALENLLRLLLLGRQLLFCERVRRDACQGQTGPGDPFSEE
jgi:hypothetical protein